MDYVYEMTWSEFRLRLTAYHRMQKRLDYRQRDIMYQIYVSNWGNPKKKPVSKDRYWNIDGNKAIDVKRMAETLKKAKDEYKRKKKLNARVKNTDRS